MVTNWIIAGLVAVDAITSALSVIAFKQSGAAPTVRGFWWYQVWGNFWGFASVLALTFLTRYWPLKLAYPITVGLAILLVQLVAVRIAFGEIATPLQVFGGVLIVAGIMLVAYR